MRVILSPETNTVREMLALSRGLIEGGTRHLHLFFHSSSLRPGLSPFTASRRDVQRLYDVIERYVDRVRQLAPLVPATVSEAASGLGSSTPAAPPKPTNRTRGIPTDSWSTPRSRRLVVVTYHYPPDGSVGGLRWAGLTKHLVRAGWEVHVVTASRRAPGPIADGVRLYIVPRRRTLNDQYVRLASWLRRVFNVPAPSAKFPPSRPHGSNPIGVLRRELGALMSFPDESRGWVLRAAATTRRLMNRMEPDAVVSSGPPHGAHLAARLATALTDVPYIMDLRDPWVGQSRIFADHPVYGTPITRNIVRLLERFCVQAADGAICNTPELRDRWQSRYPGMRLSWVPNGVDLERLPTELPEPLPGFSLTYAGTLYGGRDLRPVARAFAKFIQRHPDAAAAGSKLRVAGTMERPHASRFAACIEELGLAPYVETLGTLPEHDALTLSASSDVSVVLAQEQEVQVPAKLYEAFGLGVLPLVVTEAGSATAREAKRLGAAIHASDDLEGMVATFERTWRRAERAVAPLVPIDYEHLSQDIAAFLSNELLPLRRSDAREPLTDPRANWLWLIDVPRWEAVLEVVAAPSALHRGLAARFDTVTTLLSSDLERAEPIRLPAPDQAFDCVVLHGVWDRLVSRSNRRAPATTLIAECHRVLRLGGCLYLGDENPDWFRRFGSWARLKRSGANQLAALLQKAGFADVRPYYADPSYDGAISIVPATRRAMLAIERFNASRTTPLRSRIRRALVAIGLHRVLEPALLVTARR